MSLINNLNFLMKRAGLNPTSLAKALHGKVPQATIFRILSGESESPQEKTLKPIADYFGVTIGNLRYDDLESLLDSGDVPDDGPHQYLQQVFPKAKTVDDFVLRRFETGGGMGGGLVLRDQPGIIESWRVSRDWLQKNVRGFSTPSNLCIVTGFGDSMLPLYKPGDPIIVDTAVTSVEFDAIYFFRVGEEGFIKRLQRIPGIGIVVISENKAYRDWTITADMDFQIFGRVLKLWRSEDF